MTDKPAESAVERYYATKADTLFNKYGEAYEVVPRQRADAALTEVQDERDAALKRERVATMFSDAFEDAANGAHWMLEYERGLNRVLVAIWQYASRADVWGGRGSYSCVDLHVDQPESYRIELVLRAPDATHGAFPDVSYACADRDAMMEFLHGLGCALLAITEVENRI